MAWSGPTPPQALCLTRHHQRLTAVLHRPVRRFEIDRPGARTDEPHLDYPLVEHALEAARARADRQATGGVVEAHRDAAESAARVAVAEAVVFIQFERPVGARIDH